MERTTEKPRLNYNDIFSRPAPTQYPQGTIAQIIGRVIDEMDGTPGKKPVKVLGDSHRWTLKRLQRDPIGKIIAAELTEDDVLEFCKRRLHEDEVKPGTINQDVTYLAGALKYARAAWKDCKEISAKCIEDVVPFLSKNGYIGKSIPRTRRPLCEEIYALVAYFAAPVRRGKQRVMDMGLMTLWQYYSGRRVGESCALLWEDWNRDEQTILVRKMKDPKNRNKQKVVAIPEEAQALLTALWDIRNPSEPRIFPFNKKSVCAAYTHAKKPGRAMPEGINDLHLHDSRRDVTSRLLEKGYTSEQTILVTGHETTGGAFRVYAKPSPATFKNGPRALQPMAMAA